MSNTLLQTPSRKVKDATTADVEAALAEARAEGGFAVLEDGAGTFAQYDGARVEVRKGEAFYRVDLDGVARRAFQAVLAGSSALPDDLVLSWREASDELEAEGRRAGSAWRKVLVDAAILLGLIVIAVAVGAILLTRAT